MQPNSMMNRLAYIGAFVLVSWVFHGASGSAASHAATPSDAGDRDAVRLACDLAESLAAGTPGVSVQRSTGVFTDEALPRPAKGCAVSIRGSFQDVPPGEDAATRLRDGFTARGWQELLAYSADGKDGTAFAFRKAEVLCLFRGKWSGGADGEPSVPRDEAYDVSVFCTRPADQR